MSDARAGILARIRSANGRAGPAAPGPNPVPERARGDPAALVERFVAMAVEASASVARVAGGTEVAAEVAGFLSREGLPAALVMAPDPALDGFGWSACPGLAIRRGRAEPADAVSVTPVVAGIAETGSLMVVSGAKTPNTLHFLPDTHIAILHAGAIVGGYEDAWARLPGTATGALPRVVTLITGPSRSSDIERTVQIGVHGPRRLHIVLIDGQET